MPWARVMDPLTDLANFARLASGLKAFLRTPVSRDAAHALIRRRLDERDARFLAMVDRAIFGLPSSPYRRLLALARCERGDLRQLVRSRGLDDALRALRAEGVYVTFEEFKGRQPIVRSGETIPVKTSDFGNPFLTHHFWTETGGSTGRGTRVSTDLAWLADLAPYRLVAYEAHGLTGAPKALWGGLLPAAAAINSLLMSAATGDFPRQWFTPIAASDLTSSLKYPLATYSIVAIGRLHGVPLPWPRHVPLERADMVARWAADAVAREGRCHVATSSSMALRVCLAAEADGLDLTGATFSGGSEPMTAAKAAGIRRVGARAWPSYFATEAGAIGMSCGHPADDNDQHLLADGVALVQHPRTVPGTSAVVEAFNITTLLPTSPLIMLNVELDDYGVVERRSCGCVFEALGFTHHIRHIRSYRKLTGEGVTLVGSEMERILEEVLPARFGGTPLDYQISEAEDAEGLTRLRLVVSPRVPGVVDEELIGVVLGALAKGGAAADHARATWARAGTLTVVRAEPVWTDRGKLLPLHLQTRNPS
jgi:hypothetical protein